MSNNRLDEFKRNIRSYIGRFDKKKYDLSLYNQVIDSEELTEKEIKDILCWKLAGKRKYEQLSERHRKLIDRAIEKIHDINNFKKDEISKTNFDKALEYISPYGPVIRIFLLHICKPKEYALFDQHVFRVFYYSITGEIDVCYVTRQKVDKYYNKYCSFFTKLCEKFKNKYKPKEIDGALMVYGKELKKMAKELQTKN